MKKILVMLTMLAAAFMLCAAGEKDKTRQISLADARALIGKVIQDPTKATVVVKALSPADQVKFIAEVNAAISEMPGSNEERAAKFLNVNHAALKGAAPGNLTAMLGEVFATVPVEHLTIISERFAADLFNRAADPSKTYTDAQYVEIVKSLMAKLNDRLINTNNGGVRAGFVGLMFIRAANGTPADIVAKVIEQLPFKVQNIARTEWYKPALGDGQAQTYEPMLDSADAGVQPSAEMTIRLAGPQLLESMLSDVVEWVPMVNNSIDPIINVTPLRDQDNDQPTPNVPPVPDFNEPGPYKWQSIGGR